MRQVFRSIPVILSIAALTIAAIGAAVAIMVASILNSNSMAADRILLNYSDVGAQELPETIEEANKLGWVGTVRCHAYHGRYVHKQPSDMAYPLSLILNPRGKLIGIYLYTDQEQPSPPWMNQPEGIPFEANLETSHWGLGVYISDPAMACGSPEFKPYTPGSVY